MNTNPVIVLMDVGIFVMSGGVLYKMLVLGIDKMVFAFSLTF
jgi:hypothetical protein